jgi:hypothetical protein
VSRERNRYQQWSIADPVVITDASNDIMLQNKRAEHLPSSRRTIPGATTGSRVEQSVQPLFRRP